MSSDLGPRQDVVVRRCTVEVVRRGGWSWGPDPDLLTRRVLDALPELLARELDALPDGDEDIEITEPVVLDVHVGLPELLAGSSGRTGAPSGAGRRLVDVAVRASVRTSQVPLARSLTTGDGASPAGDPDAQPLRAPSHPPGPPILGFAAELAARHELAPVLDLLPQPTRDAVAATLAQAVGPADPDAVLPALLLRVAECGELAVLLELLPIPTLVTWRELWVASAAPAGLPRDPGSGERGDVAEAVTAALDAAVTRRRAERGGDHVVRSGDPAEPGPAHPATAVSQPDPARDLPLAAGPASGDPRGEPLPVALSLGGEVVSAGNRVRGPVEVESVLPFLVAGALARVGVLDALAPALTCAARGDDRHLLRQTQLFAAALAYTVLAPLHRGWQRAPGTRTAAAAFADLDDVRDEALTGFLRRAADAAPVLDAVVALTLCRGHTATRPLLLTEVSESAGGGLLLVDPEGLFPIGWTDESDAVVRMWSACGRPNVLLGATPGPDPVLGPVSTERLRRLTAAGMAIATDLPPTRGEHRLRVPGRSAWISPELPGAAVPDLIAHLALLPDQLTRVDDLVRALAVSRRAAPLAPVTGLARTLPLIAALGLGTISWLLWQEREPPDPLLALERLADLSGVVRYSRDEVAVVVPLGRRHADLLRHGLLADVHDVPWLNGRTLTLSGG
ncbi:hypothetical protein [Modestobacter excelsi]|uniref:hypothetical protein n=1 Tax=Modestobacter excelsi TaxID=2213161 RepID=UPI00110CE56C|nr:hypothetical protein [Modestobacter excelsi]